MGRNGSAFTHDQLQTANLYLRCWQISFDLCPEPEMGRVIVGHDDRVLHVDPFTQLRFMQQGFIFGQLLQLLHPIIAQRWASLEDNQLCDFAVDLLHCRCWIRFIRSRAIATEQSVHWYLELRRLEGNELPAIGVVDDLRISVALAFLHDNFASAPSLAQVAKAVHVSPFHFHRLFSKIAGISPKKYLQHKQLQVARWML